MLSHAARPDSSERRLFELRAATYSLVHLENSIVGGWVDGWMDGRELGTEAQQRLRAEMGHKASFSAQGSAKP